jgi:exopolyphosphatase/guanosine-5'-triphosphate,3'-diphosphate pyrophosphatase
MPTKERIKLKGLPPKRADIIPMGATILETFMKELNLESIYVSDRGLRWGLLYDWIEKND